MQPQILRLTTPQTEKRLGPRSLRMTSRLGEFGLSNYDVNFWDTTLVNDLQAKLDDARLEGAGDRAASGWGKGHG